MVMVIVMVMVTVPSVVVARNAAARLTCPVASVVRGAHGELARRRSRRGEAGRWTLTVAAGASWFGM